MNSHLFFSIYVYIFLSSTLLYNRNTSRGLASADQTWKPFTRKRMQQQDSAEFFEMLMKASSPRLANIFPLLDLAVTLECKSCNAEPSSLELCRTRRRSTSEAAQELHVGVRDLLHREARPLLYHPAGEWAEHPPHSYRSLHRKIRVAAGPATDDPHSCRPSHQTMHDSHSQPTRGRILIPTLQRH
jgi:hypothetical protein